jgi:hypothetical protein
MNLVTELLINSITQHCLLLSTVFPPPSGGTDLLNKKCYTAIVNCADQKGLKGKDNKTIWLNVLECKAEYAKEYLK